MKFTAAVVLAAAAGASAHYKGNATVVTEVVDVYTTYCPAPTEITHGTKTYTVTEVRFRDSHEAAVDLGWCWGRIRRGIVATSRGSRHLLMRHDKHHSSINRQPRAALTDTEC